MHRAVEPSERGSEASDLLRAPIREDCGQSSEIPLPLLGKTALALLREREFAGHAAVGVGDALNYVLPPHRGRLPIERGSVQTGYFAEFADALRLVLQADEQYVGAAVKHAQAGSAKTGHAGDPLAEQQRLILDGDDVLSHCRRRSRNASLRCRNTRPPADTFISFIHLGIGGALGLPAAAAVIEYINWRGLFMADFVIALAIVILIAVLIPAPAEPKSYNTFDFVGTIGLGVALLCLLLAIIDGGSWGWGSPETIGLFAAALVVALAWGYWELRHTNPLVDLRTTRKHNVLFTNIASIFIGFAMYSQSLLLPQLMQLPTATGYGLGLSMLEMGLCMAPSGLGMMAVSSLGAHITKSRGAKTTLICGALVMAVGYACAALLMHSLVALVVASVIGSMGTGLAFGAMPTLIMNGVPTNEKASANSFNTVMRSIGTSVSSAVIAMILAGMSVHLGGATIPSQSGFRVGLLIGCFVAVVAAAISLNIRHTKQV